MPMVFLSSGLFLKFFVLLLEKLQNGHLHNETHIYTALLPTYRIKTVIVHRIEIQLTCLAVFCRAPHPVQRRVCTSGQIDTVYPRGQKNVYFRDKLTESVIAV